MWIGSKYWRPSRSASGQLPLTSMQAPHLVRNSRRRKRRLLPPLVQSSSRPRVLVPSRLVVLLPLQVGEVRPQEAWVQGCLRFLDRKRSKPPLTQEFLLVFAVMCARGLAHSPSTRMQLYALKGLYIFAELLFQCLYVVRILSCFCCLLYTIVSMNFSARGPAHPGT